MQRTPGAKQHALLSYSCLQVQESVSEYPRTRLHTTTRYRQCTFIQPLTHHCIWIIKIHKWFFIESSTSSPAIAFGRQLGVCMFLLLFHRHAKVWRMLVSPGMKRDMINTWSLLSVSSACLLTNKGEKMSHRKLCRWIMESPRIVSSFPSLPF